MKTFRAQLKDVVLEGGDAFARANGGLKLFDYMGTDERLSKLFNRTGFSVGVLQKFLEVYKGFEGVNVLVDVGGGVGNTLGFVTSKYPNIKGINFDLTCALTQAPSYPNVEHVAGDMFVEIPRGDAIILKVRHSHKHLLLSNINMLILLKFFYPLYLLHMLLLYSVLILLKVFYYLYLLHILLLSNMLILLRCFFFFILTSYVTLV